MPGDLTAYVSADFDEDFPTHQPSVNTSETNWRENLCREVRERHHQDGVLESDGDDDLALDQPLKAPNISSIRSN